MDLTGSSKTDAVTRSPVPLRDSTQHNNAFPYHNIIPICVRSIQRSASDH